MADGIGVGGRGHPLDSDSPRAAAIGPGETSRMSPGATQQGGNQMKRYSAILATAFISVAGASYSQDVVPPPPINEKDIGKYCIYASRIYSNGSQICVVRGSITLGCDKGEWKVDLTKFGLDCRNENANLRPGEFR
jgi:hypothetical protein